MRKSWKLSGILVVILTVTLGLVGGSASAAKKPAIPMGVSPQAPEAKLDGSIIAVGQKLENDAGTQASSTQDLAATLLDTSAAAPVDKSGVPVGETAAGAVVAVDTGAVAASDELGERLKASGIPEECLDRSQVEGVLDGSIPMAETACPNQVQHAANAGSIEVNTQPAPSNNEVADPVCDGRDLRGGQGGFSVTADGRGGMTPNCSDGVCTTHGSFQDDDGNTVNWERRTRSDGSFDEDRYTFDSSGNLILQQHTESNADATRYTSTYTWGEIGGRDDEVEYDEDGNATIYWGDDNNDNSHIVTMVVRHNPNGDIYSQTFDSRSPIPGPITHSREVEVPFDEAPTVQPRHVSHGNDQGDPLEPDQDALANEFCKRLLEDPWQQQRDELLNGPNIVTEDTCHNPVEDDGEAPVDVCGPQAGQPVPDDGEQTSGDVGNIDDGVAPWYSSGQTIGALIDVLGLTGIDISCNGQSCDPTGGFGDLS